MTRNAFSSALLTAWLSSDIRELAAAFASVASVAFVSIQLARTIDDRYLDREGFGHRVVTSYYGSDGHWLRPRILAFLPPQWPIPSGVGPQTGQGAGTSRLLLSIDDYGLC